MYVLASVNYTSPIFWAVIIGWVISVTFHEFAHGIVAYWGGDYTIKERGGLTLNPLQYADPVMTFIIPVIFVFMGGIPLTGAVTYVRRDLLRSRAWNSAVSVAGPLMNVILFFCCIIPLMPAVGWIDPTVGASAWSHAQLFLGAMAVLQLFAAVFNMIPIPPLDGFGVISPLLPLEVVQAVRRPQVQLVMLAVLLFIIPPELFQRLLFFFFNPIVHVLGFDAIARQEVLSAFNHCLFK